MKVWLFECIDFPPGGHDLKQTYAGPAASMSEDLDPLATRSLFVGNIPKHISVYELRDAFLRYGNVLVGCG
jgi:RNA recognition motif-containing protein